MAEDYSHYAHPEKRLNNPPVGLVTPATDGVEEQAKYAYDPHIAPCLEFDSGRGRVESLLTEALPPATPATEEAQAAAKQTQAALQAALKALDTLEPEQAAALKARLQRLEQLESTVQALHSAQAPFLNWTGKAERTSFEVPTVSLHVHERIDPQAILEHVRKPGVEAPRQDDLFNAAFDEPPLREDIEFYKHERGWANRLIAGDSLLVMHSLLVKEGMAGKLQMIYIDPPYGIKYGSNFQPFTNKRDVKDGADDDLTREPEQIRAFRDTWELGIHSYLTYLRDRLLLARELLTESGSVFVQISDENLHHVRELMDEVFGMNNFLGIVVVQKTTGAGSFSVGTNLLPLTTDYLIWYSKFKDKTKYNQLYLTKELGGGGVSLYSHVELENGMRRPLSREEKIGTIAIPSNSRVFGLDNLTSQTTRIGQTTVFPVKICGKEYSPSKGGWKTNRKGMTILQTANRIAVSGNNAAYIRFLNDFAAYPVNNVWTDTVGQNQFGGEKSYVVQTAVKVVERCMLMTTDPGDLVFDPTCGSGTTAYVAEKWGRRWITCDTSRVALTLARQRLLTAGFDYFPLKYPQEGLKSGFIYKTVPHVTLKSIANNLEIDEIYERDHPKIEAALEALNHAVGAGHARDQGATKGKKSHGPENRGHGPLLREWEVPFDFPEDWPEAAQAPFEAFHAARRAMQQRMDASIARNATQETLFDQPKVDKKKVRVTGPFTVEAVPFPSVLSLEEQPSPTEGLPLEATSDVARSGESARQHQWIAELLATGLRGKGGQKIELAELESLPGARYLHAVGTLKDSGERVAVSFGPEFAPLEQRQVALALDEAGNLRPAPKFLVFAAFSFDPEAAKDIDETHWPGVTMLKAWMNADLLTDDLKKKGRANESFWLIGQPEISLDKAGKEEWRVEVHGFDYFDIGKGEIRSGGKNNIAVWLLDTDYNGRSLLPTQVFFPMAGEKDGWSRLAKNLKAVLDESRIDAYHGTISLPFKPGKYRRVAVKIVDDRGIESLVVREIR